jgi:hypothetical protein
VPTAVHEPRGLSALFLLRLVRTGRRGVVALSEAQVAIQHRAELCGTLGAASGCELADRVCKGSCRLVSR